MQIKTNLRTFVQTAEQVSLTNTEANVRAFVQGLRDAGFNLLSGVLCPVKIAQPWDKIEHDDGSITWRQWDNTLEVPLVHNGTDKYVLVSRYRRALTALMIAEDVLKLSAPHERDYVEPGFRDASHQHDARMIALRSVIAELTALGIAVLDQR